MNKIIVIRSLIAACIACILSVSYSQAQLPAPAQRGIIALVGGDIHPVTGPVIPGGTIIFSEGKIIAMGVSPAIPDGTQVIDISGKHVYPGLILARTSLGLTEIGRLAETTDMAETGNINPNVRTQVAFHPSSEHIGVAAIHGITTIVPTPVGGVISGQAAAMHSDGWTWEQMVLKAPVGMAINWPSMGNAEIRKKALQDLDEAFGKARRYKLAKAATGLTTSGSNTSPRSGTVARVATDLRWEAMLPVIDKQLPVFVTANEITQIQAAIAWAEKEQVRMVIVGGRDAGYIADQLAAKNIPVMLSPVIAGPTREWEAYDEAYSTARQLHQAGVEFCIAGEASAAGAYRLSQHAAAAVAFGLPEQVALEAITIKAAKLLEIDHLTGSLETGKDASLIVTNGNPLEIWTNTEMVFIQGRRIDNTDKHLRLYQKYVQKHIQENQ
jgi:imidazolonepropionase-like amidohydrolase